MSALVLVLVSTLALAASAATAAPPAHPLLSKLRPALPDRPDANVDQLFPVGFSRAGAFAWFRGGTYPEAEGYSWQLVIQSLVSDRELVRYGESDAKVQSLEQAVAAYFEQLVRLLAKHGIDKAPSTFLTPGAEDHPDLQRSVKWSRSCVAGDTDLCPFPLLMRDGALTVELRSKSRDVWTVALRSSEFGLKTLGTRTSYGLAGPVPVGAFVSPYEPRIAVVFQQAGSAMHGGDPTNLNFHVMGAHLEKGFPKKR